MNVKVRLIAIVIGVIVAVIASKNRSDRRSSSSSNSRSSRVSPTVVDIHSGGDPRLKAAEAEAIRRWPEFVAAFKKEEAGATYAVKAKFTDGDASEWMWVEVESMTGDVVRGKLRNQPDLVKNIKQHQAATVEKKDIDDWVVFHATGAVTGDFTSKILKKIEAEQRARQR